MRVTWTLPSLLFVLATLAGAQNDLPATWTGQITWNGIGPVSGVTVSIADGAIPYPRHVGSAVTDANGRYKIVGNMSTTYGNLSVNVHAPALDNSFGGVFFGLSAGGPVGQGGSLNISFPRLAIFVPELLQNGSALRRAASIPFGLWHPYHVLRRGPGVNLSHVSNAKGLAAAVDQVRVSILTAIKRPKTLPITLDLVGVGSGGLAARAYVANHTGRTGENRVDKCVTIGTPHLGMVWPTLLPANHPLFAGHKNLYEMRVDHMLLVFPGQLRGGYGSTRFYLIGSDRNMNPFEPEVIPGWTGGKNDDGFVSTHSAIDNTWGGKVITTAKINATHAQVASAAMSQVLAWLR